MTADSTVAEIEAAGGEALGIELNVTDRERSRRWWRALSPSGPGRRPGRQSGGAAAGRWIQTSGLDPALLQLVVAMNLFARSIAATRWRRS